MIKIYQHWLQQCKAKCAPSEKYRLHRAFKRWVADLALLVASCEDNIAVMHENGGRKRHMKCQLFKEKDVKIFLLVIADTGNLGWLEPAYNFFLVNNIWPNNIPSYFLQRWIAVVMLTLWMVRCFDSGEWSRTQSKHTITLNAAVWST